MKLIFKKDENNEISVQLQNGLVIEDFSYNEMIRQLLKLNNFDDTEYFNFSEEEKAKVESMLERINAVFVDETYDALL